jgi:hypothetical protein
MEETSTETNELISNFAAKCRSEQEYPESRLHEGGMWTSHDSAMSVTRTQAAAAQP